MALTEENGMGTTMLVQPANNMNNGGFGFGNDGGWWILLLFLLLGNGNWGMGGGFGGDGLYPWMNNSQNINNGFRDQMLNSNINSIRDGIYGISNQLCNGFNQAEIANNARQLADMQQMFGLQSSLQQCCCDNRAATADLKYTIATENCADRAAVSDGVRDILAATQAQTQAILDKMCQDKIDAKNEEIANLRQQLNMATLAASQTAQTAAIRAGQVQEIDAMYNRLVNCPIPTQPVYGSQPIFTCPGNNGCGCGAA